MVAGHLQEKKGYFYMVLNFTVNGKRQTKWIPTGLAIKGNKKRAEAMLMETRQTFIPPADTLIQSSGEMMFEKNGMRKIRFHDLRHTCASLLLKNGVPMKQIQEWLGHSDFSTTANIYAHLDYNSKLTSADAMISGMSGALNFVS